MDCPDPIIPIINGCWTWLEDGPYLLLLLLLGNFKWSWAAESCKYDERVGSVCCESWWVGTVPLKGSNKGWWWWRETGWGRGVEEEGRGGDSSDKRLVLWCGIGGRAVVCPWLWLVDMAIDSVVGTVWWWSCVTEGVLLSGELLRASSGVSLWRSGSWRSLSLLCLTRDNCSYYCRVGLFPAVSSNTHTHTTYSCNSLFLLSQLQQLLLNSLWTTLQHFLHLLCLAEGLFSFLSYGQCRLT